MYFLDKNEIMLKNKSYLLRFDFNRKIEMQNTSGGSSCQNSGLVSNFEISFIPIKLRFQNLFLTIFSFKVCISSIKTK